MKDDLIVKVYDFYLNKNKEIGKCINNSGIKCNKCLGNSELCLNCKYFMPKDRTIDDILLEFVEEINHYNNDRDKININNVPHDIVCNFLSRLEDMTERFIDGINKLEQNKVYTE
jgi:hypothetical protein